MTCAQLIISFNCQCPCAYEWETSHGYHVDLNHIISQPRIKNQPPSVQGLPSLQGSQCQGFQSRLKNPWLKLLPTASTNLERTTQSQRAVLAMANRCRGHSSLRKPRKVRPATSQHKPHVSTSAKLCRIESDRARESQPQNRNPFCAAAGPGGAGQGPRPRQGPPRGVAE